MWNTFAQTVNADIRQMRPLYRFVLAHAAMVLAIAAWHSDVTTIAYETYIKQFAPLYFIALPLFLLVINVVRNAVRNPAHPLNGLFCLTPQALGRMVGAAITFSMLIFFMGSFTTFKTLMPKLVGGFPYDRLQADLDAFLHGGIEPGGALMEILGNPFVLQALQWNYAIAWMAMAFIPVFFIVLYGHGVRLRYCLNFVLVWSILGNLLACIFLSAGPAFYAHVTGDAERFASQMQILDQGPGSVFQSYLWQSYLQGTTGLGTGISAFPSVHVGIAMMNFLYLRDINRIAGLAGLAYVIVILASSVLLGWHYAIDGYVSIAVVWLIHGVLRRLLGEPRTMPAAGIVKQSPTPAKG